METETAVRCILFFGDRMLLKKELETCKKAAELGIGFRGFQIRWLASIRAEEVWDEKQGACSILIFPITRVERKADKPDPDVLRTVVVQVSDDELMFWLRQYGVSGLDTLCQDQSFPQQRKAVAGA